MTTQSIGQIFDLTGKVAVVTGGAMGIGEAIVLRLAEAGASVMIADLDAEAARQTAARISAGSSKVKAIRANVSSPADATKVARATVKAFGSLDIIVNNAGVYPSSSAVEMSEEFWNKVLSINLSGVFFYSQAAAREMIKSKRGGKIINIAAVAAQHPMMVDQAHYSASKGGVVSLTKALALELAPHNIFVNAIAPGAIMTPGGIAQAAALEAKGESLEEHTMRFLARLPLGRVGEPDDVAKVVLFLASAAADYITGSVVTVDGGYLLS
jgi:2-deoxy-D-gluconate 3-dehydrogenase